MLTLHKRLAAFVLGLIVAAAALPSFAQAPDHPTDTSGPTLIYRCCIRDEQYAEHPWCATEIYRDLDCARESPRPD
jgi:hypothetical protein